MVTMTDDSLGVTVEGETEAQASKLLRVARRKAAKEQAARDVVRHAAETHAKKRAYDLYYYRAEKGAEFVKYPQGYRYFKIGEDQHASLKMEIAHGARGCIIHAQMPDATATIDLYGEIVVGYVENGGGFPVLAFLHDTCGTCPDKPVALGSEDGVLALVHMPDMTPEMFRRPMGRE